VKTSIYICADGTLTYGPYGGKAKIIKAALPVAIVDDEETARNLIITVGRRAYDMPVADPDFRQALRGRQIEPGYGPDHRYYYSGPEFEIANVDTVFAVRRALEERMR
jgi:hypothetical protein